ncbi:hypothetical protein Tco_1427211 [Tanacetum coccineum]
MTKAQDQRSHSMKEQAYNKDKDQDQDSRTKRQSNLKKPKVEGFKDLASGEIVSLNLLSRTWKLGHSVRKTRLQRTSTNACKTPRYAQWKSRFMRYVDTKPNMKEPKKCIFNGPYVTPRVFIPAKPATKTDPDVPEHTVPETYENTLLENRAYIDAEAEAIHMILSEIEDEIYSTVDACKLTFSFCSNSSQNGQDL